MSNKEEERGLGLAIIKGIIEAHNGWVVNEDTDFDYIIETGQKVIPIDQVVGDLYPGDITEAKYVSGLIAEEKNAAACPVLFVATDYDPELDKLADQEKVSIWKIDEDNFKTYIFKIDNINNLTNDKCILPKEILE